MIDELLSQNQNEALVIPGSDLVTLMIFGTLFLLFIIWVCVGEAHRRPAAILNMIARGEDKNERVQILRRVGLSSAEAQIVSDAVESHSWYYGFVSLKVLLAIMLGFLLNVFGPVANFFLASDLRSVIAAVAPPLLAIGLYYYERRSFRVALIKVLALAGGCILAVERSNRKLKPLSESCSIKERSRNYEIIAYNSHYFRATASSLSQELSYLTCGRRTLWQDNSFARVIFAASADFKASLREAEEACGLLIKAVLGGSPEVIGRAYFATKAPQLPPRSKLSKYLTSIAGIPLVVAIVSASLTALYNLAFR